MRKSATRTIIGSLAVVGMVVAMALPVLGGGRPLTAELSGDNEVPPSGSEATGTAQVTLNQGLEEVCVEIQSSGYEEGEVIVAGHIHAAPAGVNGDIVVNLQVTSPNHSICVDGDDDPNFPFDAELIKDIRQNPSGYYVNLHSNLVPTGVIRGQLSK
jgi:hypothetical protein